MFGGINVWRWRLGTGAVPGIILEPLIIRCVSGLPAHAHRVLGSCVVGGDRLLVRAGVEAGLAPWLLLHARRAAIGRTLPAVCVFRNRQEFFQSVLDQLLLGLGLGQGFKVCGGIPPPCVGRGAGGPRGCLGRRRGGRVRGADGFEGLSGSEGVGPVAFAHPQQQQADQHGPAHLAAL